MCGQPPCPCLAVPQAAWAAHAARKHAHGRARPNGWRLRLGGGTLPLAARPPPRRRPCRSVSPGRGGQSRRVLPEGRHATSEMEMCEMCARQREKRAAAGLVVARGGCPAQARLPCGAGLRRLAASQWQAGNEGERAGLGTCPQRRLASLPFLAVIRSAETSCQLSRTERSRTCYAHFGTACPVTAGP